jgi:hypothetical protein
MGAEPPEDQDPLVDALRPEPADPVRPTVTLTGLLGNGPDDKTRRLYFSPQLDHYAEFSVDDALHYENIPAERSPVPGRAFTRVILRRDSTIVYTRVRTQSTVDPFDLDIRLGAEGWIPPTSEACADTSYTCLTQCGTCNTCRTSQTCMTCYPCSPIDERTMTVTVYRCRP